MAHDQETCEWCKGYRGGWSDALYFLDKAIDERPEVIRGEALGIEAVKEIIEKLRGEL